VTTTPDDHQHDDQWLEEVEGEAALGWVRAQNQRSLAELRSDPNFDQFHAAAIEIATSQDRIPYGAVRDGFVYNFWQDDEHIRGLWRRTPLDSYGTDEPDWETVLDVDMLARSEDANWVYKGANVHRPSQSDRRLCTVSLSDGGKDAVVQREFDIETCSFVDGGFVTPEAKQSLAWVDEDTVLLATDWGDGTVTESGYPAVVKQWTRGTPLEMANEAFRGRTTDVGVWPFTLETDDGNLLTGAVQSDTFFTSTYWLFTDDGPIAWPIPPKSTPQGIFRGHFLLTLQQDWEVQDAHFRTGDLVAFDLQSFLDDHRLPPVELVFGPSDRQAVNGVAIADGTCLLSINDNVVAKILRLEPPDDESTDRATTPWVATDVELPGTGQADIAFADRHESTVFLNYEDFLTPTSLMRYEGSLGEATPLKSLQPQFDTAGLVVEQFTATSSDGTSVPYFLVRREDIALDGSTPTLLYGYGGFQISLGPSYSGTIGRLWLEHGGAYVLANIRGGGEFGPEWHQAGLKTNRQRIYDDFIAVAEAVIDTGVSAPRHLGIMGGSNGGLLMGVVLNQRPDLWNAVVIQVPLLDMLRFHRLLAGASWVDEYGSPEIEEERAFLESISPVHNFDATKPYPTPLFVTSTKDDRVHPGHARKLAKRFEDAGLPFLYYENIDGGHSAAANQTEAAKRSALEFTYLHRRLF
jgi:prolyl oligopeptidase